MRKRVSIRFLAVLLAAAVFSAWAPAADDLAVAKQLSNAYANLAERVAPAVVSVTTTTKVATRGSMMMDDDGMFPDGEMFGLPPELFDRFFGGNPRQGRPDGSGPRFRAQPRERVRQGVGSGILVDKEGHILTNAHVVNDADKIRVKFANDDRSYTAEVIGKDELSDLAVLQVKGVAHMPTPLPFGDSDALRIGNIVMAIGSPMGFDQSVTIGAVSAKGRKTLQTVYENYIQIDAAINPGNSGGPLINLDGEVVGVNAMISTASGGFDGIAFAIPSNQAKAVYKQLVEKGRVTRGWIGITMNPVDADMAEALGVVDEGGVMVANVATGGPAEKGGVKRGDMILAYDGKPVKDMEALRYFVADTVPDTDVSLTVLRAGKRESVKVKIETQPEDLFTRHADARSGPSAPGARPDGTAFKPEGFGIEVRNLTDGLRSKYGWDATVKGVVVSSVDSGSGAAEKGLPEGTVIEELNGAPTPDVAAFRAALDAAKGKDVVVVYARIPGQTDSGMYISLKKDAVKPDQKAKE